MTEYTFTSQGHTFTRVSKTAAKKAFINGFTIALCPCKLRPGTPWYPECIVNRETLGEDPADAENEFNRLLNRFEFYNCTNETGRYTAFFIGKEKA